MEEICFITLIVGSSDVDSQDEWTYRRLVARKLVPCWLLRNKNRQISQLIRGIKLTQMLNLKAKEERQEDQKKELWIADQSSLHIIQVF